MLTLHTQKRGGGGRVAYMILYDGRDTPQRDDTTTHKSTTPLNAVRCKHLRTLSPYTLAQCAAVLDLASAKFLHVLPSHVCASVSCASANVFGWMPLPFTQC